MLATLKAKFDGKHFLPETSPALPAGRTYLLRVEEVDSTTAVKIAALRDAMRDRAFLDDLQEASEDFAGLDAED